MGEEVPVNRTSDLMSSSVMDTESVPDHLVVMVHGILGSSGDWEYAANEFVKQLPDKVFVHCSERNMYRLSLHGVDVMGERLAEEVLEVIGERPEIRKISFIAHSIGGLVARYAIARLYRPHMGNICGLEPINFIAVATPHLGSRGNKQVPLLLGFVRMEYFASRVIHWLFGRAGRHLFLTDSEDGKPPLLLRMITDSCNLPFISALRAFKNRVAYANADCDQVVGWRTSSIRRKDELPKIDKCINEKYPHVVHEEYVEAKEGGTYEDLTSDDDFETMEEKMVNGLSRVSWEKVDVSFHNSLQWLFSHSIIQVKFSFMYEGADVIQHMIDHFRT
ncbi:hypothetical protein LUZ63_009970 [Rhynchospora breviuscula]|uniref:DUF676 domain-containing protein n=1 Tax=Rhynchospora breviuscula TaxID=2022672 RepID=A0A9Q0CG14_9POAL|nr:hypothetical protein LUZ63_009970 [Rhynchospora breviuscula]